MAEPACEKDESSCSTDTDDETPILPRWRSTHLGHASPDPASPARLAAPRALVVGVLVGVQFSFALSAVLCGSAMRDPRVEPLVFAFLRDALGAIVLLGAAGSRGSFAWPGARDVGVLCAIGVCGIYFGQLFMLLALKHISVLNAAVLAALMPASTMVLGHVVGREPLALRSAAGRYKACGLALAVGGALVMVFAQHAAERHVRTPRELAIGNAYALAFCVGGSAFPLLQRELLDTSRLGPLAVAGWGTAFGAGVLALTLPVANLPPTAWELPRPAWRALAYVVLITSAFNYACLTWCNAQSSAVFVTAFNPLQLVFAAALGASVLGEPFTPAAACGAWLVCAGLSLLTWARARDGPG